MLFRCKNCGGNIVYSPEKKAMCCPHCESIDSEEKMATPQITEETKVTCASCGAPIDITEHTSATKCPNCGKYAVFDYDSLTAKPGKSCRGASRRLKKA